MKKIWIFWIAVCGLVFSSHAAAPLSFTKCKVDAELFPAPAVTFKNGGVSYGVPTKSRTSNKWLMIRVEFTPPLEKNTFTTLNPAGNSVRVTSRGWMDNIELSVRVLFDTGLIYQKKNVYGLFSGQALLLNVRKDGQKHYVLMFVPAQLLDRYLVGNNVNGIVRPASKNNFMVEAVFSCDGTVLGKTFCNVPGTKLTQQQLQFNQMAKNVPEQLRFPDTIQPQSKTPWAGYYPDAFDLTKESPRK